VGALGKQESLNAQWLETVELPTGRYKSRFDLKANNFLTQAFGVHAGKHFPRNKGKKIVT
jgi:hypothetical protein